MKTSKKTAKRATLTNAKKMVDSHNRRVRKSNATFLALKPAEKRVAIAYDVLDQLKMGRLNAVRGVWLADPGQETLMGGKASQENKNIELQKILQKKKECDGCAM